MVPDRKSVFSRVTGALRRPFGTPSPRTSPSHSGRNSIASASRSSLGGLVADTGSVHTGRVRSPFNPSSPELDSQTTTLIQPQDATLFSTIGQQSSEDVSEEWGDPARDTRASSQSPRSIPQIIYHVGGDAHFYGDTFHRHGRSARTQSPDVGSEQPKIHNPTPTPGVAPNANPSGQHSSLSRSDRRAPSRFRSRDDVAGEVSAEEWASENFQASRSHPSMNEHEIRQLEQIFQDEIAYRRLLNNRGPLAQSLLDYFQKEYLREAIVWRQLKHPNLLPCLGLYYLDETQQRICLVSPWMVNGNLSEFLRRHPVPSVNHRLQLMLDIARGLFYLHTMHVIHGDLKGVNILITQSHRACIADFGLSHVAESQLFKISSKATSNQAVGTIRWAAPEVLNGNEPTKESDVYSCGLVYYEIVTLGDLPFKDLRTDAAVTLAVSQGKRPEKPQDVSEKVWSTMEHCWKHKAGERITAEDLLWSLPIDKSIPLAEDWDDQLLTKLNKNVVGGSSDQYQEALDFLEDLAFRKDELDLDIS
ncbi:hypothetical protein VNI00_006245 [Paramarasmius palmivorus]|uniref:Protein kinase domain-containing protein n=1 Tax=Paramarasmius palmivorus TaxID=297713 RepID=A0AAW0D974_9AGAR